MSLSGNPLAEPVAHDAPIATNPDLLRPPDVDLSMTAVTHPLRRPELLAPAGDFECLRAAVENGADAVYFGLDAGFNARARAANFPLAEVPAAMAFLHQRGVKGYVTLNTLVFCDELPDVVETVRALTIAGVDAVLVQDIGVVRLMRALSPDLPIHASTQFTLTSAEGIAVAKELGIERTVLARELSLGEIADIHAQTDVELEAFVHGALCVAYSGQCLTSESLGGRSANRGQCAQACRLPYELICDGRDVDLGDQKYLLSPQDLAAYDLTPDLITAGVVSFKIEGRLKSPEYVANITRHYRQAIDNVIAGRAVGLNANDVREMELSFSRGFSPGWLEGCDHKRLVPALSSAKRGVLLGKIADWRGTRIEVELQGPVRRGDGLVLAGDRLTGTEQGGRVYGVFRGRMSCEEAVDSGRVELEFAREAIDFERLFVGQEVWKTDDPELTTRLRQSFTAADPIRKLPVDLSITATVGEPLRVVATTATGVQITVNSEQSLEIARKHALTADVLREQLSRLGHTVFELRDLTAQITGTPMIPLSVLGKVRRDLITALDQATATAPPRRLTDGDVLATLRSTMPQRTSTVHSQHEQPPRLHVLCRTAEQLQAALQSDVTTLIADYQDLREYRGAIEAARLDGRQLLVAPPRIQKPEEMGLFRLIEKYAPDGVLVRNLAGLRYFQQAGLPVVGDYSLNATNDLTVQYLIDQGCQRITASYDMNRDQLLTLVDAVPPAWLEVVLHQHMPMFHMEHCVFCAVLSPGTNKTNCGRPCDHHLVQLRDRVGMEHPLKADVGCRNTLYNALPQSGAELVPELFSRGVRDFRLEFVDETPAELRKVVDLYRDLLNGRISGEEVWRKLKASNRVGVTRGTLEERRNPLAIL
ncbi:U32 family peptidase [bacterium]|nr:U32 family peptidase [bacterium]